MTREEIMAMEPGRELDALVAEKVMGWKLGSTGLWQGTIYSHYPPHKAYENCDNRYFKPSSRINAAWEVVEKFDKNTFNLNWLDGHNHYGEGWHCKLEDAHAHKCETAPEAICKAALIALL